MLTTLIKNPSAIASLESLLFTPNGQIKPAPAASLSRFSQNDISAFCLKHAIYQLPTIELIAWLRSETREARYDNDLGNRVIEIGAGNGNIGRNIPVMMTDSHLQAQESIKKYYQMIGQPVIAYGQDVIQMDGNTAVNMFKPSIVIAAWVTQYGNEQVAQSSSFGVRENEFAGTISRYLMIGNELVHNKKNILKTIPLKVHRFDWLFSRSMKPEHNIIYDFDFSAHLKIK